MHDFGEVGGSYFLLMEYVDGVSLRERLEARDLDASDVLEIVPQVCAGLQYAHEHGVVHRDIEPENILLDDRGRVKIADFGLARILEGKPPALTRKTQVMGTPHSMAPEQVNRPLEVDHRADIHSLGVVLYEMLTSELPAGRFAPPSARCAASAGFDPVVLEELGREPAERRREPTSSQKKRSESLVLPTKHSAGSSANDSPPSRSASSPGFADERGAG